MAYNNSRDTSMSEELQSHSKPTHEADLKALDYVEVDNGSAVLTKTQELTKSILRFLSTASNETLGACAVGLASITYFVLGRLGLVIIGVVGGVILHATWEENVQSWEGDRTAHSEARRRKEASLNVVERVLDWREQQHGNSKQDSSNTQDIDFKISAKKELNFLDFQPATATALGALTDAVIDNYVKYGSGWSILWQYANP